MYQILISFFTFVIIISCSEAQALERQIVSTIECHEDSECQSHALESVCIGNTVRTPGHCQCKKNFIPQANSTYFNCLSTPITIDDLCELDIQCEYAFGNEAECINNKCSCRYGSHFVDNTCYKSVRLGETCYYTKQCYLKDGNYASCASGKCTCSPGQHPHSSSDGESCEMTKYLGDSCTENEQCITENSQCSATICNCKSGYSSSLDGQGCLKESNLLGEYCTEDSQCEAISDFAYCESFRCICRNHYHKLNNQCYKNVKLNASCTNDKECWVFPETNNSVSCKEGICFCRNRYSGNGRICINAAGIQNAWIGLVSFVVVFMTIL